MHVFGSTSSDRGRSRASTLDDVPLAKRPRKSVEDTPIRNMHSASNGSHYVEITSSSSSQSPSHDQTLMTGYRQALQDTKAFNNPPEAAVPEAGHFSLAAKTIGETTSIEQFLQPPIALLYGENFGEKSYVHRSLLANCSPKLRDLFNRSAGLKEGYRKQKALGRDIKLLLPPHIRLDAWSGVGGDSIVSQAVNLIVGAYKASPLLHYQLEVRQTLETRTEELLQIKHMLKESGSAGGIRKKDIPSSSLLHRLQLLKPEAVLSVLRHLHQTLERIKATEDKKAIIDEIKAAAKERIYLTDADSDSIGSLVHWVYFGKLQSCDADRLCKIHGLAERLGLTALEDQCLATLSGAASLAIDNAATAGVSLHDLLDENNAGNLGESLPGVVRAVFTVVVQRTEPPKALKRLIIDAIANSADVNVVETSLGIMSHELTKGLCMALTKQLCGFRQTRASRRYTSYSDHHPEGSVKPNNPSDIDTEMKGENDLNHESMRHSEDDSYDGGEVDTQ